MRWVAVAILAFVAPIGAWAQSAAPIIATPLPPAGSSQAAPTQAAPAQAAPAATPAPPAAPVANPWLPQGNAVLQVLDKINAQSTVLTVKVGQSAKVGTLNIQVQACSIRPADQPQDATAFLSIADGRPDAPSFSGWMLAANPSLSMLQHPIYDVRVIGCKA